MTYNSGKKWILLNMWSEKFTYRDLSQMDVFNDSTYVQILSH